MILDEIMAYKRDELVLRQRAVPLAELKARAADRPPALDFAAALRGRSVGLIAEIKRASPSKGLFCPDLDPEQLATTYASNGATAISVLTDTKFFQGQLEYLARVKNQLSYTGFDDAGGPTNRPTIPVMRKDFVFAPYQVYESLAYGADALLLIVAVLSDDLLAELIALTHSLGLTALVEIHNAAEAERALRVQPRVVGINNRNLHDFSVDLATFGRLRGLLPKDVVTVAESGVSSAADVRYLAQMDADAVLVGEALVTAPDVAAKVQELASQARLGLRQQAAEVVGR
jgi:indole-3-glycerol phosphate synthase